MAFYVDTSALLKLVTASPETESLQGWLAAEAREPVACDLVRTELVRTVRLMAPECVAQARKVLNAVTLTTLTPALFEAAGRLDPAIGRVRDAIHLACALDLGDDLDGLVTYDGELAAAAARCGVDVVSPRLQLRS